MKKKAEIIIERFYIMMVRLSSRRVIKKNITSNMTSITSEEKIQINNVWGKLNLTIKNSFFTLCKNTVGFDPRYMPEDIYNPIIKASLNPAMQSIIFENKCLYDIFFTQIKRPLTICKNIYGCYYNDKDEYITKEQAVKLVLQNDVLIIKPGIYSDSGNSVKKFTPKDNNQVKDLFDKYNSNFIVQAAVKQSNDTAIFNKESVNTMRISSLYLNGKVSILSSAFRCGQNGATVDNTGAGGIIVGIDNDGKLFDYGFDLQINKHYESSNGIKFSGRIVPGYKKAIDAIFENHAKLPTVHLIGWDFAIDENNEPVMIEVNIGFPGIIFEQLCSGPFFGDRTQEVIDYVINNKPSLRIRM